MSWKSFVSAGLLCVLASPLFAVGPTLNVVNGPTLDSNGDWQWTVSVVTSFTDTPIAAELGFDADTAVVSATKGSLFDGANTDNPGGDIFGTAVDDDWENYGTSGFPEGVQMNADQAFAAVGSEANLPNSPTASTILTIVTSGPNNLDFSGALNVLGAYGPGGDEARLAELTGATTSANYRYANSTATRTLNQADINLTGLTDDSDFGLFLGSYEVGVGGKVGGWSIGDFDRNGEVNDNDFAFFLGGYDVDGPSNASINNLSLSGTLDPPPGGGSGAGAIPEPASIALMGLALLGGLGLFRRRG